MVSKDGVCTIGGGTGMPIINQALVRAGFTNIASIVTTFDSGGDTGRLRTDERGRILAFSDYWRSLISLWDNGRQKQLWQEMLTYRNGRGQNFGNTFFYFMAEKAGGLSLVDELFVRLTGTKLAGRVIPVSLTPANICFKTVSGKEYQGEHFLDDLRMSTDRVEKVWLEPEVEANPEAIKAIAGAKTIIICPGSMYGSVLVNFLPQGIIEAYKKSRAKKILFTNIMSVANENHKFSQDDYVKVFGKYLEMDRPFDLVVMPDFGKLDQEKLKKVLGFYALENSFPIYPNKKSQYQTLVADIAKIEVQNWRLRHSVSKLTKNLKTLA
ncbi:MAG: 2-phospho-L-lactate transferase CofD family protein [Candidatus Shapirobacteria bacterium]|nr:2-phospho-L-lactate transferase CofD family protein [Candidatus Shapirobacteria bacterium]